MAFTDGNDINVLQGSDAGIVGAGLGDDIYIVSPFTLTDGEVTLSDTEGVNTLQLIGGLEISSSVVVSNALQLTLSNGAIINVNGADTFIFNVGGNVTEGEAGTDQDFVTFVTTTLGTTVPAAGEDPTTGGEVVVGEETPGTFTLTPSADSVIEGESITLWPLK